MLGRRWRRLSLNKPPGRVFIDSPDRPVNLGLEHPPRPHVRSGWLDWRLWPYGFILRSTCSHSVNSEGWKPCRRMMSGMSRVFVISQQGWARWMGESAAADSFIFIHLFPAAFVISVLNTHAELPPPALQTQTLLPTIWDSTFTFELQ